MTHQRQSHYSPGSAPSVGETLGDSHQNLRSSNHRRLAAGFVLSLAVALTTACGYATASHAQSSDTVLAAPSVSASRDLVFDLVDDTGSYVISPLSLASVMGMMALGGTPDAQNAILDTFDYEEGAVSDFLGDVSDVVRDVAKVADSTEALNFDTGNAVWLFSDVTIPQAVELTLSTFLSGSFESVDRDNAVSRINDWGSSLTRERIPSLLDALPDAASMILTNATVFEGQWAFPFIEDKTSPAPFHLSDGSSVDVPMMTSPTMAIRSRWEDGFRGIELPLAGKQMVVAIVTADTSADLAPEALRTLPVGWLMGNGYEETSVRAMIPQIDLKGGGDITPALVRQGMAPAIGNPSAFANLAQPAPILDAIVHKVVLNWDEAGLEAAAATAAIFSRSLPIEPKEYRFDQPFVFAVRLVDAPIALFYGYVGSP